LENPTPIFGNRKYITILEKADVECPPPDMTNRKGKRGPVKRTKARNLLERLLKYKDDVLRFMDDSAPRRRIEGQSPSCSYAA